MIIFFRLLAFCIYSSKCNLFIYICISIKVQVKKNLTCIVACTCFYIVLLNGGERCQIEETVKGRGTMCMTGVVKQRDDKHVFKKVSLVLNSCLVCLVSDAAGSRHIIISGLCAWSEITQLVLFRNELARLFCVFYSTKPTENPQKPTENPQKNG